MLNISLQFDPSAPSAFLATYRMLLGNVKPKRSETLVVTTKRLVREYMEAEHQLLKAASLRVRSVGAWLSKRKAIKAARERILSLKQKITQWVSSSLRYYSAKSSLSLVPLRIGHSIDPLKTGTYCA